MPLTLQVTSVVSGAPNPGSIQSGSKQIGPNNVAGANTIDAITQLTLANGDNTIAVPTGSTGVVIVAPLGNGNVLKLKGVGGDTGFQIAKTGLCAVLIFDSAAVPANIVVNSTGAMTAATYMTFDWF